MIDRPKGFKKTFVTKSGPKELEYPLDYGYFPGVINPEDNEDADVFLGTGGPHHGRFMKGKPGPDGAMVPDERKWYAGLHPHEYDALKNWWETQHDAGLTWDWTDLGDQAKLLADAGVMPPAKLADDFWARNEARKAEALADPAEMIHIREGYIPCPGCKYRYHVMPDDNTCPKCGAELRTRLRGLSRRKSAFDVTPVMLFVKRADDDARPFTIAVDLDGTLAEQEEPFNRETIGKPREHAVEWTRLFHKAGARIIIFTVRGSTELVKAWLDENAVPYDYVNENPDQPPDSSGKVFADVYWDDRAFNAVDPNEHGPEILRRVVAHGGKDTDDPAAGPSPVITIRRETVVTITGPVLLAALEGEHEHEGDVGADDPADPPDTGTGDRD